MRACLRRRPGRRAARGCPLQEPVLTQRAAVRRRQAEAAIAAPAGDRGSTCEKTNPACEARSQWLRAHGAMFCMVRALSRGPYRQLQPHNCDRMRPSSQAQESLLSVVRL